MGVSSRVRVLAVAGAAALAMGLVGGVVPAQAATTTTVDSVTYSTSSLSVDGLELKPVTVSAHITSTATPHRWQFILVASPNLGTVGWMQVIPAQTSGSMGDGVWTATVQMPSSAAGTWFLDVVNDCATVGPTHNCDFPWIQTAVSSPPPTFTVVGTHRPIVTWGQHPRPVTYPQVAGIVSGHVVDADTGLPMAGVSVGFNSSSKVEGWCTSGSFQVRHLTDSNGAFSFSTRHLAGLHHCMGLGTAAFESDGEPSMPWFVQFEALTRPRVTVTLAASHAKVGAAIRLNGTYTDAGGIMAGLGKSVRIQQLSGNSTWIQVASAPVRASGRWTTTIRPIRKGRNIYRTYYAGNYLGAYPTSSKPFVITGT